MSTAPPPPPPPPTRVGPPPLPSTSTTLPPNTSRAALLSSISSPAPHRLRPTVTLDRSTPFFEQPAHINQPGWQMQQQQQQQQGYLSRYGYSSSSQYQRPQQYSQPPERPRFYGLLVRGLQNQQHQYLPLPLTSTDTTASIFDFSSEVTITQTYRNTSSTQTLEAEYIFPLDENSSVTAFACQINNKPALHGLVKEKTRAKEEYLQAKSHGNTALLLEQHRENIFRVSIGNLPPRSLIQVTLTYLTTLKLEGKSNVFVLPKYVAPKYQPKEYWWSGEEMSDDGDSETKFNRGTNDGGSFAKVVVETSQSSIEGIEKQIEQAKQKVGFFQSMKNALTNSDSNSSSSSSNNSGSTVPDAPPNPPPIAPSLAPPLAPPIRLATTSYRPSYLPLHHYTIAIEILSPSRLLSITSPSHDSKNGSGVKVVIDEVMEGCTEDQEGRLSIPQSARITYTDSDHYSSHSTNNRDFILHITPRIHLETRALLSQHPETGEQVVQLAFCPSLVESIDAASLQVEILFLIDQSGSMGGSPIANVRTCLEIFLRSLPIACRFNLISFGTNYTQLFPVSRQYAASSINEALAYVQKIDATYGGTEIYEPLRNCLMSESDPSYPRQIFLLTDGQVSNVGELIGLVKRHSGCEVNTSEQQPGSVVLPSSSRVFTFGVGNGVDRYLVQSLAHAGRGEAEFITTSSNGAENKKDMMQAVMRSLIKAVQQSWKEVEVEWEKLGEGDEKEEEVENGEIVTVKAPSSSSSSASPILQCPSLIPPIFSPHREIIYAMNVKLPLSYDDTKKESSIRYLHIRARRNRSSLDGSPQTMTHWKVPLNVHHTRIQHSKYVHQLAAKARIHELQLLQVQDPPNPLMNRITYQHQLKQEIIQLSLKHQIMSNETSFLIVDERSKKEEERAKQQLREMEQLVMSAQLEMYNSFIQNSNGPSSAASSYGGYSYGNSSMNGPSGGGSSGIASIAAVLCRRTMILDDDDDDGDEEDDWDDVPKKRAGGGGGGDTISATTMPPPPPPVGPSSASSSTAAPIGRDSLLSSIRSNQSLRKTATSTIVPDLAQHYSSYEQDPAKHQIAGPMHFAQIDAGHQAKKEQELLPDKANIFLSLLNQSQIDGMWLMSEEVVRCVRTIVQDVAVTPASSAVRKHDVSSLSALATEEHVDASVISTLLVIWFFVTYYSDRQSEWQMLVGKAKAMMRNAHKIPIERFDALTTRIIA